MTLAAGTRHGRFLLVQNSSEERRRVFRIDVQTGLKSVWRDIVPEERSGLTSIINLTFTPDGKGYAYGYSHLESDELYIIEGLK